MYFGNTSRDVTKEISVRLEMKKPLLAIWGKKRPGITLSFFVSKETEIGNEHSRSVIA